MPNSLPTPEMFLLTTSQNVRTKASLDDARGDPIEELIWKWREEGEPFDLQRQAALDILRVVRDFNGPRQAAGHWDIAKMMDRLEKA